MGKVTLDALLFILFFTVMVSTYQCLITSSEGIENYIPKGGVLHEGDVVCKNSEDPSDRYTDSVKRRRWPAGRVYFTIDRAFSSQDRRIIAEAMDEIQRRTCIKFENRTNQLHYIRIQSLKGCWSWLGKQNEPQVLSLEIPQCIAKGTVMHQLMHAIGFWHEQSRSDRDQYITIHWDNIVRKEMKQNFAKHTLPETDHMNEPYDYQSVMHFDAWAFSESHDKPTITPKDPRYHLTDLGKAKQLGTLTNSDAAKIRKIYDCS